jgi:uncharacterized repeat protein (TIGR03847 family)
VAPPHHEHLTPDRVVVGTVGEPGQRTFYLQARSGSAITSVVVEKAQVSVLADRMEEMLDDVVRRSGGTAAVPAVTPERVDDLGPLDVPLDEEFRVGALSLAWLSDDGRVEVVAREAAEDEEDSPTMTIQLTGAQARAFIARTRAVVSAGRPPCPFCAQPLDPAGHICPRQNGYRRRS